MSSSGAKGSVREPSNGRNVERAGRTWYGRRRKPAPRKPAPKGGYDRFRGYDAPAPEAPAARQGVDFALATLVLGIVAFVLAFVPVIRYVGALFALGAVVLASREMAKHSVEARIRLKGNEVRAERFCRVGRFLAIVAVIIVVASTLWGMKEGRDNRLKESGSGTGLVLSQDLGLTIDGPFVEGADAVGRPTYALPVTVENKSGGTCSFTVQVEALDGEGRRVAAENLEVNNMRGGATEVRAMFQFVAPASAEALKTATFRVATARSTC